MKYSVDLTIFIEEKSQFRCPVLSVSEKRRNKKIHSKQYTYAVK